MSTTSPGSVLRKHLINADVWLGRFADLKLPAYIEERWSSDRQGAYTAEEWSHARSSGYRGNGSTQPLLDSEEGYRQQLATHNAPAVSAALRLARCLDFHRYNAIIEIGCGEMAQAYTLVGKFPHLRYRATDFDPYVIAKCSRLPLLDALEKAQLDVTRLSSSDLTGFKLLVGWEIIYALDASVLQTILTACRNAGVPFLAATTQLLGPGRFLRRTWRDTAWGLHASQYQQLMAERRIRMHGWNPTVGYYRRQAQLAGMRLACLWLPPADAIDNFSFMLFESA